jgi:hypothetical protein
MCAVDIANKIEKICECSLLSLQEYQSSCHWCQKHLTGYFENIEQMSEAYEFHAEAFLNIAATLLTNSHLLHDFVLICDPWAIFCFDGKYKKAIQMLKVQGKGFKYKVPKSEKSLFKEFANFSFSQTSKRA